MEGLSVSPVSVEVVENVGQFLVSVLFGDSKLDICQGEVLGIESVQQGLLECH